MRALVLHFKLGVDKRLSPCSWNSLQANLYLDILTLADTYAARSDLRACA